MFFIPIDIMMAILNPFGVGFILLLVPISIVLITIFLRLLFKSYPLQ